MLSAKTHFRPNFSFRPTPFNPGDRADGNSLGEGNLAGYDASKGGPVPWIPLTPATSSKYDKDTSSIVIPTLLTPPQLFILASRALTTRWA